MQRHTHRHGQQYHGNSDGNDGVLRWLLGPESLRPNGMSDGSSYGERASDGGDRHRSSAINNLQQAWPKLGIDIERRR